MRASNSIGYFLPPNLGGIYGQVQYVLHENTKQTLEGNTVPSYSQSSPSKTGQSIGARIGYADGPLDVALALAQDNHDGGTASGLHTASIKWARNRFNTVNLGASYNTGPVKLFGELSSKKQSVSNSITSPAVANVMLPYRYGTSDEYHGYLLGASVPVGVGLIRASYGYVKAKSGVPPLITGTTLTQWLYGQNSSASVRQVAIGYVHNLSKRTRLYATVAYDKVGNGQNNAAIGAGTSAAYTSALRGFAYAPRSSTGYDLGINHSF